jgi:hypothetical protein
MGKLSYKERMKELLGILIVLPILIYYGIQFIIRGR